MNTNSVLLQNLNVEQLTTLMGEVFRTQIETFKKQIPTQNDSEVLLDEEEACAFLKTNSVTLWRWVKAGKIKVYKFSHKNYYKRNEILETITHLQK